MIFGKIHALPDSSLEAAGTDWKLLIDFPFDEVGRSPQEDLSRLDKFRQAHPSGSRTFCWVPSFFKPSAQKDLGNLVILEHILTGERFGGYANNLPYQDRAVAKALLENQRSQLRQRVLQHLAVAYGIDRQSKDSVDSSHELSEHFQSLWQGFDPQPPVGANLKDAMLHLLEQALEHQFPAHPKFEAPPKGANLKKVYEEVHKATEVADGRVEVDKPLRPLLRAIANPLLLGEMHETVFLLGQHWKNHFNPKVAEAGGTATVGQLRHWINLPRAMGLPKAVENLVILLYAEQTNRTFYLHGAPTDASLTTLQDQLELRTWVGPPEAEWKAAVQRAASIFWREADFTASERGQCHGLGRGGEATGRAVPGPVPQPVQGAPRPAPENRNSARRCPEDEDSRRGADPLGPAQCGTCQRRGAGAGMRQSGNIGDGDGQESQGAGELADRIDATSWGVFGDVAELSGEYQTEAAEIRGAIATALQSDEHVVALAAVLKDCQTRATQLLAKAAKAKVKVPPPQQPPQQPPQLPEPPPGKKTVSKGERRDLGPADAKTVLAELDEKMAGGSSRRLTLTWRIDEDTTRP